MHQPDESNKEAALAVWYQRFLSNEISREELFLFMEQLAMEERQELLLTLMTDTWEETVPLPVTLPQPAVTRKVRRTLYQYSMAAIVLLIVVGLWLNRREEKAGKSEMAKTAVAPRTDRAPGGNKALLTLADGRTIVLDSAANGTVVQQGGMKVTKQANGVLRYESAAGQPVRPDAVVGYNTLTTPRGGQFRITLPDGSQVWLNAVSSLRYPVAFTGRERVVELTGEGYFEVTQDAQHPFVVRNEKMDVRVLGTAFNMMCYADEAAARTTLVNGAVKADKAGQALTLEPGQQAIAGSGKWKVVKADIEETLAWKNGLFRLKSADVTTIMRQIARWYDVDIVYAGEVPANKMVGYMGREEGLSKAIAVLDTYGIHCRLEGRKLIVD